MMDPMTIMGISLAFGMVILVAFNATKVPGFAIAYIIVAILLSLFWIIGVGYPGDGAKGLQTAYGRSERGYPESQYARQAQPPERYMRARAW